MTLNVLNTAIFLNIALAQGLLIASAALPDAIQNPPVIINETISMPKGAYLRIGDADDLRRGDIIAMPMNIFAQDYLGGKLGYLKDTMLIKRVAGLSGDVMCRQGVKVTINAQEVNATRRDSTGSLLPYWTGCHVLLPNEVFLLGDHASSFDSRYFGPVTKSELSGTYKAVMTW
jgi:conjugative transfer signal peptidase TraF